METCIQVGINGRVPIPEMPPEKRFLVHSLTPCDLTTELRRDPLGIDTRKPRFGWALQGGARHAVQGAWRIQVGTDSGAADCWDSGRIAGDVQLQITYAGKPLVSRMRYFWRVQVWDGVGSEGPWSAPAWFETAFLDPTEFAGSWLGVDATDPSERRPQAVGHWLRPAQAHDRPFTVWGVPFEIPAGAIVNAAFLHTWVDKHGHVQDSSTWRYMTVNGVRIDACEHLPEGSVLSFDVRTWLKPGANHIALRFLAHPDSAFIGVLEVDLADGTRLRLPSIAGGAWRCRGAIDEGWGPHKGPVGWDNPLASDWTAPVEIGAYGKGPGPAEHRRNRLDRSLAALLLKRTFHVAKPLARARLYATACGIYELALDGARFSDLALAPGWTDYRKRIHYQTYDVTANLHPGENELSATVGDGWWCGRLCFGHDWYGYDKSLKLALHLDYADGTSDVITSDPTWQAGSGPIRLADFFDGQTIDLTVATRWRAPTVRPDPPGCLQAQPDEPVRELMEVPVRTLTAPGPGRVVLDFGQNLVGHIRLRLRAPRGTVIMVRHAEVLDLLGEVWTENLRSALAIDRFVCSGGDDVFAPTLTSHGFRYVEISGLPGGLRPEQVSAIVIGSDTPDRGTFTCDNPLLNRLQSNIRWGQRSNLVSIPTDCPQRDERLGWTADTQVFTRTAIHNADCAAFYAKYVDDMLDAQHASGAFPDYAPTNRHADKGRFGWADAGVVVPWTLWRCYGDTGVIEKAWAGMRRYLGQRDRTAVDDLNLDWSFGDWVSPAPQTPNDVLGPIYHAWMHRLMAEMAEATGRAADATHHRARFTAVKKAWRAKHLAADGRIHSSDTQAAYACGLRAHVIEPAEAAPHFARTVERHTWHLNTGFLGTYCLLPALTQTGRDDIAWRVLTTESYPGWLYTVKNGATTMWERWNTYSPETGPVNVGNMNSYNHYAFGAVGEWMYSTIAGLDRAEDDVAFQRLVFRPIPGGMCKHAQAEYRSVRGTVRSAWSISDDRFTLEVTVPPNCTAEVHVPGLDVRPDGARHLRDNVYAVGAGLWKFIARI